MTKLIVAFRNFVNAPKMAEISIKTAEYSACCIMEQVDLPSRDTLCLLHIGVVVSNLPVYSFE
jgi:hypothetical protein